jgi:TIGR00251 family protein
MPNPCDSPIQDSAEGTLLTIHVQPNAARSNYVGLHGDALKIRIASPPVDGAANEALCRFLSEQLAVPMSQVIIRAGHGSRRKRVLVRGVTAQHTVSIFKLQKAE